MTAAGPAPTPGDLIRPPTQGDGARGLGGQPSGVPGPGPTGDLDDPRVADAVSRLDELVGMPLADQVEVFTDIHRRLAAVLADPDSQA